MFVGQQLVWRSKWHGLLDGAKFVAAARIIRRSSTRGATWGCWRLEVAESSGTLASAVFFCPPFHPVASGADAGILA